MKTALVNIRNISEGGGGGGGDIYKSYYYLDCFTARLFQTINTFFFINFKSISVLKHRSCTPAISYIWHVNSDL